MLAYGGWTDQDMNNIRVDQITASQNVVEGIVLSLGLEYCL